MHFALSDFRLFVQRCFKHKRNVFDILCKKLNLTKGNVLIHNTILKYVGFILNESNYFSDNYKNTYSNLKSLKIEALYVVKLTCNISHDNETS